MIPDLSHAICYYTTWQSRWGRFLWVLFFIASSSIITIIGLDNNVTWSESVGTRPPIPFFIFPLLGIASVLYLGVVIPSLFYSGPTIAIAEEGLYLELWGGNLALIEWSNLAYVKKVDIGGYSGFKTPMIEIYVKDLDELFYQIEQRTGKLPFLLRMQYTMRRSKSPFQIRSRTIRNGNRDEIINRIDLALISSRENQSQPNKATI